jgi:hypothetical protein
MIAHPLIFLFGRNGSKLDFNHDFNMNMNWRRCTSDDIWLIMLSVENSWQVRWVFANSLSPEQSLAAEGSNYSLSI